MPSLGSQPRRDSGARGREACALPPQERPPEDASGPVDSRSRKQTLTTADSFVNFDVFQSTKRLDFENVLNDQYVRLASIWLRTGPLKFLKARGFEMAVSEGIPINSVEFRFPFS